MTSFTSLVLGQNTCSPAVQMLCWLLPSPQKLESNILINGGGWVLWSGRGQNWLAEKAKLAGGSTSAAPAAISSYVSHRQPEQSPPDCTDLTVSTYYNVTSTSLRSNTARTLDSRTSWSTGSAKDLQHSSPPLHTILLGVDASIGVLKITHYLVGAC